MANPTKASGLPPRHLLQEAAAFCLLSATALALGLLVNAGRAHPLPLRYASRENRLDQAVGAVVPPTASPASNQPVSARTIDLEEFQQFVSGRKGIVVDARTETFYRLGHVPGALNLSREGFESDYAALLPLLTFRQNQPIAVYCSGADCQDSQLVANALAKLGYKNLLVYPEGWEQWKEAGLPQEPPAKHDQ